MKPSDYDGRGYDPPYGYYDGPPDLSRELAAADKIISDLEKEVERLRSELDAGCDVIEMGALLLEQRQEIERLQASNHHLRGLLETAVDAWECGHWVDASERPGWNSLIGMQQLRLTKAWWNEAKKVRGE